MRQLVEITVRQIKFAKHMCIAMAYMANCVMRGPTVLQQEQPPWTISLASKESAPAIFLHHFLRMSEAQG